jgi:hypothetical protein
MNRWTAASAASAASAEPTVSRTEADQRPADAATDDPHIGWDLRLHPEPLNAAFWREKAAKYMQWDSQVSCDVLLNA